MGRTLRFEEIALRIETTGARGLCLVQITHSSYGTVASCKADFTTLLTDGSLQIAVGSEAARGARPSESSRNLSPAATAAVRAASPEEIGDQLFRALFSGPVLATFLLALGRVEANPETGLRIRLQLDLADPDLAEIAELPWELLYRASERDFLARNPLTPVVRYLEVPRPMASVPLPSPLRILVVRSRPRDLGSLALADEQRSLLDAWEWGGRDVAIDLLDHPTLFDLRRKLLREPFHGLHFMGHGDFDERTGEGVLLFESTLGTSAPVTGRVLAEVLKDSRWMRLVVLNACDTARLTRRHTKNPFAGVASALVQAGLPAVVAMRSPISDEAALTFSRDFYNALAAGFPVDAAAAEGRRGVYAACEHSWEWATPAVFMNSPDGQLLQASRPPGPPQPNPRPKRTSLPSTSEVSLREINHLKPDRKRELSELCQERLQESPEDAHAHLVLGLLYLDLRRYPEAVERLDCAAELGSREPELGFYRALASLEGRQPRTLGFVQIKAVEAHLGIADLTNRHPPEALLLAAVIKHDYYRSQGLRVAPPSIEQLLAALRRGPSISPHIQLLQKHLTLPPAFRDLSTHTTSEEDLRE